MFSSTKKISTYFLTLKNRSLSSYLPWFQGFEPPDPSALEIKGILLASEGRPFRPRVVDFVARLAKSKGATVYVLCLVRIWGTALGFPMPTLFPSKREWDEYRSRVEKVIKALRRRGVKGEGHVLATRKGVKRIVGEAERLACSVIVMAADPPRHWFVADFLWAQEPYRVRRLATIPVYLVVEQEM